MDAHEAWPAAEAYASSSSKTADGRGERLVRVWHDKTGTIRQYSRACGKSVTTRPSCGNGVGENARRHLHIAVIWDHHNIGPGHQALKFILGEIAVHEPDPR